MQNVKFHTERATENQIINMIFDACRGNASRHLVVKDGYTVTFDGTDTPEGEHLALVHNDASQLCGSAVVDQYDC